ncbi:MAG TPA: hypothetical protein VE153_18525 [Myxococcus sp.]|nr:hypothetical protein [Myxococcus sp.]
MTPPRRSAWLVEQEHPRRAGDAWEHGGRILAGAHRDAVGIPLGPGRLGLFRPARGWWPEHVLEVPRDARLVAPYPSLDRAVVLRPGRLEGVGGGPGPRPWTFPTQALDFDGAGQGLWASGEEGSEGHRVHLLEADSLERVVSAPVDGDSDGAHELLPHPVEPVMGVSVSCGQDGTWMTFLRREGSRLVRVGGLAAVDDPFSAVGFLEGGDAFVGISNTWVRLWSFPDCRLLAEYVLPVDRMTEFTGAVTGTSVLVPVMDDTGDGRWELYQLEARTLRPECIWELPLPGEDVALLEVLPGDYLLGEERLWKLTRG